MGSQIPGQPGFRAGAQSVVVEARSELRGIHSQM